MIGIVFILNTKFAPYMRKYIEILKNNNVDFEVIYWDRLGKPDCPDEFKSHCYSVELDLNSSFLSKIKHFWGFRKFVINKIETRRYNKLILLSTLSGIFITDYLRKKYKNKYIFDVRDYSYEKFKVFKFIEAIVIKNAYFTALSSEKFKEFLPIVSSANYQIAHNLIREELQELVEYDETKKINEKKINITFIGAVRHFEIDSKIAIILGNDPRFNVVYHGFGKSLNKLKEFCTRNNLDITFTGMYKREDKKKLLKETDIINAYYDETNYANKFAMPNKYYDSLLYKIPIWANPNVYVGKRSIEAGIGINASLDDDDFAEKLISEYRKINFVLFNEKCNNELMKILNEDDKFIDSFNVFLRQE